MRLALSRTVLWSCVLLSPFSGPLGETSLGLHVLVIVIAAGLSAIRFGVSPVRHTLSLLMLVLLMSLHLVVANALSPCTDTLGKSVASHAAFLVVVLALIQLAGQSPPADVTRDVRLLVIVIAVSVVAEQVRLFTQGEFRVEGASGIYFEASHLALSVSPLLVALIFARSLRDRWTGWIASIIFFVLSGSATLFIVITICLLVTSLALSRWRLSAKAVVRPALTFVAICATIFVSPYHEEFLSRIEGVGNINIGTNVSSLVYVNGWETAIANLSTTHGIGLGFNRMGCNPRPETATGEFLDALDLGDANFNDGSFTVAKVLSELGVFGLAGWMLAAYFLFRTMRMPRVQADDTRSLAALAISAIVVVVFGGLVRGTGYFAGPVLLGLFFLVGSLFSGRSSPPPKDVAQDQTS